MSSTAMPGWYPNGNTMQYWNGAEWTEQTRPLIQAPAATTAVAEDGGTGLAVAGYVLAVLIPIVGFILGIVAVTRPPGHQSKKHGVLIIVVSVVAFIVWVAIIVHSAQTTTYSYQ